MVHKKDSETWISLSDSIAIIKGKGFGGRTPETLRTWCRKYKIGRKIGGIWYVNRAQLKTFIRVGSDSYITLSDKQKEGEEI